MTTARPRICIGACERVRACRYCRAFPQLFLLYMARVRVTLSSAMLNFSALVAGGKHNRRRENRRSRRFDGFIEILAKYRSFR